MKVGFALRRFASLAVLLFAATAAAQSFDLDRGREPMLSLDGNWRFHPGDSPSAPGSHQPLWAAPAFDDSAWPSGVGLFGHETTPAEYPYAFNTYIPATDDAGGKIAVYFRTHFQWSGGQTNASLVSTNYIDDGAVYYLNGARIGALRMPATAAAQARTYFSARSFRSSSPPTLSGRPSVPKTGAVPVAAPARR